MKLKATQVHTILPIALALILPGLSLYANPDYPYKNSLGIAQSWLLSSFLLYGLWYVLWFAWDLHSTKNKRRFIWIFLGFIGYVGGVFYLLASNNGGEFPLNLGFRMLLGAAMFMAIQYALKAQLNISRLQIEKEQVQTENYKVRLQALQSQVDPHFLFNSLNTLRSMVRQNHTHSEEFIISLSDFYRQTLKNNENTTLPLSEELTVLKSYLFLMKSRNEKAVSIDLQIDPAWNAHHLPTLALQVVVENCFKHNSMTSKTPLHINISHTTDGYISVSNTIQPKLIEPTPSGFGLDMLKKRYELLKVKEGVVLESNQDQFQVKIKLIPK